MVFENYSDMSIDELGSSLLQKKSEREKQAAKRARKNEKVQQALAVLLMGQGIMKSQYEKRMKELESASKFSNKNLDYNAQQISTASKLANTISPEWNDPGGDLDARAKSFINSEYYQNFQGQARPYIDAFINADKQNEMYKDTSVYENAVEIGTQNLLKNFLKDNKYQKLENELKEIFDAKPNDMDRAELYLKAAGLNGTTLSEYLRNKTKEVQDEYRGQANIVSGIKRSLGLINDNFKKEGGFDIFKPLTEADLAGPAIQDLAQSINLKGLLNTSLTGVLSNLPKAQGGSYVEIAQRREYNGERDAIKDLASGPLAELEESVRAGRYPSILGGTTTYITPDNFKEFTAYMGRNPASLERFATDTVALSLAIKNDPNLKLNLYKNAEAKKENPKTYQEFSSLLANKSMRTKYAIGLLIAEGFTDDERGPISDLGGARSADFYDTTGTLNRIYTGLGTAPALGGGININSSNEIEYTPDYSDYSNEQKKKAIQEEIVKILNADESRGVTVRRLEALSNEAETVFNADMESIIENTARIENQKRAKIENEERINKGRDDFSSFKSSLSNLFKLPEGRAEGGQMARDRRGVNEEIGSVPQTSGQMGRRGGIDSGESSKNLLNSIAESFRSGATNISEIANTAAKNKLERDRAVIESKIAGGRALADSAQVFYTDMSNFIANTTEDLKEDASAFANKLGDALTKTGEGFSKSKRDLVNDIKKFFTIGNKEKSLLTPESELRDSTTTAQDLKNILPQNALSFARFTIGNKLGFKGTGSPVDVAKFKDSQKETLRTAIKKAMSEGRTTVRYTDYPAMSSGERPENFYKGARQERDILALIQESFSDPSFEMFTTLGAFSFEPLENNKFRIKPDKYDFDKGKSATVDRTKPMDMYSRLVYKGQDISEEGTYNFFIQGVI